MVLVLACAGIRQRGCSIRAFRNSALESHVYAAQAATAAAAAVQLGKRTWYNADLSTCLHVGNTLPLLRPPPPFHPLATHPSCSRLHGRSVDSASAKTLRSLRRVCICIENKFCHLFCESDHRYWLLCCRERVQSFLVCLACSGPVI